MAKKEFDQKTLDKYYFDKTIDFSWMEKPSQHLFRWRCLDGTWSSANRRIRDNTTFLKGIGQDNPTDVYFSTSSWLDPINLPRLNDKENPRPVLLNHLIVFDIDISPFSITNIEKARKIAVGLHIWVEENYDFELINISFSGSKGFHLIYHDNDRTLFAIEDLLEREDSIRVNRKELMERVISEGFEIDKKVTADTRRIIRMPGTIHGKTGWMCQRISFATLQTPFKTWHNNIPKHDNAVKIPKNAKPVKHKKSKRKPAIGIGESETNLSIEVSNHLPGTKNRSALLCWLPKSWGGPEQAIEKAKLMMKEEKLGSSGFWISENRILMICPRSIARKQLIKIFKRNGFLYLSDELKNKQHYWTRISGLHGSITGWNHELDSINVLGKELDEECLWPWSSAHVELARRMELYFSISDSQTSGDTEPSIRMVKRE